MTKTKTRPVAFDWGTVPQKKGGTPRILDKSRRAVNVRIDEKDHGRLQDICWAQNVTMSALIRVFIQKILDGNPAETKKP